jgi:hypothetical protein
VGVAFEHAVADEAEAVARKHGDLQESKELKS